MERCDLQRCWQQTSVILHTEYSAVVHCRDPSTLWSWQKKQQTPPYHELDAIKWLLAG